MSAKNSDEISLDKLIEPSLLLLVQKKPSHGYELIQNFNCLNPEEEVEPGTIYRHLRKMEKKGFLESSWKTSESGPARRLYNITGEGMKALDNAVVKIEQQKQELEHFLAVYREQDKQGGNLDEA
ncbi:MAG: PadR family transcriptional regulator [Clostridiales bacterium]|nr:PadR family transcriptional regulator [Clostridiales bacterium]MCF8022936.1 PadR family transcriptional regulator [Clostridiales bacterium]